jgi:hypothetical protein
MDVKIDLQGMTLLDFCRAHPEQVVAAIEQHNKESQPPSWCEVWNFLYALPAPPKGFMLGNMTRYYVNIAYEYIVNGNKGPYN